MDVVQIFPLPETSDYLVRVRQKEREERRSRIQNRDLTRFRLTVGSQVHDNLPKRRLAFLVIQEAINRGAEPLNVCPGGKHWLIVSGDQDEENILKMERDEGSSSQDGSRFFAKDDELFKTGGKTYAVTKMWGQKTLTEVDRIINEFSMEDVAYEPVDSTAT